MTDLELTPEKEGGINKSLSSLIRDLSDSAKRLEQNPLDFWYPRNENETIDMITKESSGWTTKGTNMSYSSLTHLIQDCYVRPYLSKYVCELIGHSLSEGGYYYYRCAVCKGCF